MRLMWFFISLEILVAVFFAVLAFFVSTTELIMGTGGLAMAFAVIASADIKGIKDMEKIDKILTKLDEVLGKLDTYHSNKS